jgi:uncharacterized Zn finger protein
LGKKGLATYRELAEKQWEQVPRIASQADAGEHWTHRFRITRVMESLARQSGDIEELVKIKSRDLSSAYNYLDIAEVYKNARQDDKALEWAERGLKAFPQQQDRRLLEFVANEYYRRERGDEAMTLIWATFVESPVVEQYKLLKDHADKLAAWPAWREKALSLVRKRLEKTNAESSKNRWLFHPQDNSELVKIFLWEKDIEAAWQEAQKGGRTDYLWHELAKKRESEHPADSANVYRQLVEATIARTGNEAYREAVELVGRINKLMKRMEKKKEFDEYVESVRTTNKRKRNFIALLEKARFT